MNKFFIQRNRGLIMRILVPALVFSLIIPCTSANPLPAVKNESDVEVSVNSDEKAEDAEKNQEAEFLVKLKEELNILTFEYENIKETVKVAKDRYKKASENLFTLSEQLKTIDTDLKETQTKIDNVTKEIAIKEGEIEQLFQQIDIQSIKFDEQKKTLSEFVKMAYLNESSYLDFQNNEVSVFKLLLSNKQPSEIIQNTKYLNILKETGEIILTKLDEAGKELETRQKEMHLKRSELKKLKERLSQEETNLQEQKKGKEQLLIATKNEELIYKKLLEESLQEQKMILEQINDLPYDLAYINKQINNLKANGGENFFKDDLYDSSGDLLLRWPVSPSLGISAYYHDPSYSNIFGVTHNAIDLPTPQATPIHSPAFGVVVKVRDNGYGYSYLVISHSKNVSTLYGHVSKFLVKEGDPVFAGQIVAMSGGLPGTIGAGYMTTGAHLHFEVFKNGKHVDPLYFLDLSHISLTGLPEKYQIYYNDRKDFFEAISGVINLDTFDSEDLLSMEEDEDLEEPINEEENTDGFTIDSEEIEDLSLFEE